MFLNKYNLVLKKEKPSVVPLPKAHLKTELKCGIDVKCKLETTGQGAPGLGKYSITASGHCHFKTLSLLVSKVFSLAYTVKDETRLKLNRIWVKRKRETNRSRSAKKFLLWQN